MEGEGSLSQADLLTHWKGRGLGKECEHSAPAASSLDDHLDGDTIHWTINTGDGAGLVGRCQYLLGHEELAVLASQPG